MTSVAEQVGPAEVAKLRAVPDITLANGLRDMMASLARQSPAAVAADPWRFADNLLECWGEEACRIVLAALLPGHLRRLARSVLDEEKASVPARPLGSPTTAQRVNSWYAGVLASKVNLGDRSIALGDCTVHQLHDAASKLYHDATTLNTRADRFVRLADHLEDCELATVAGVDQGTLQAILRGIE